MLVEPTQIGIPCQGLVDCKPGDGACTASASMIIGTTFGSLAFVAGAIAVACSCIKLKRKKGGGRPPASAARRRARGAARRTTATSRAAARRNSGRTHRNPMYVMSEPSTTNKVYEEDGGAAAVDAFSDEFYERVVCAEIDQWTLGDDALANLDQIPTVSLKAAVEEAAVHTSTLRSQRWQPGTFNFAGSLEDAMEFGEALLANTKSHAPILPNGFTTENAATIYTYTQETPLHDGLNGALGGWGKGHPEGAAALCHYIKYYKLFHTACCMLPTCTKRLFRGISKSLTVVLEGKRVGDLIQFSAVTSTSANPAVVRDPRFLGENGTILQIAVLSAVPISQFSEYAEDEVLILPGAKFKIDRILQSKEFKNVFEVAMHEVPSDYQTDSQLASTVYATPDPLELYNSVCQLYENMDVYLAPGGSVTLPPFFYDETHGEYGMVRSVADQPTESVMSTCTTEKLPFYDLATKSDPTQPFYDKASPTDVDVLAATTNSAGVSAVYSIPLDTGNDFAAYDRVRAETLPSNNSMAVYATHTAAPRGGTTRKRSSTISETLETQTAAPARNEKGGTSSASTLRAGRARTATLGWDATLPAVVRPVEGRYQNGARARAATVGWDERGRTASNHMQDLPGSMQDNLSNNGGPTYRGGADDLDWFEGTAGVVCQDVDESFLAARRQSSAYSDDSGGMSHGVWSSNSNESLDFSEVSTAPTASSQLQSERTPGQCKQKTSSGSCSNAAAPGSTRCFDHMCTVEGCKKSKSSKAVCCPKHAKDMVQSTEVNVVTAYLASPAMYEAPSREQSEMYDDGKVPGAIDQFRSMVVAAAAEDYASVNVGGQQTYGVTATATSTSSDAFEDIYETDSDGFGDIDL